MSFYIPGLQEDFVRSLGFVALFEFVNKLKQSVGMVRA
ncbi:hypothetical protein LEP1GSC016_2936 [Leptospira borgpetersenii serovar Hardjo-bovis str. Sponselee]|uniref:Uncharacterized protein n=3 Tax=Leptospira borgpetersenii TaxID=174 RepID=A0A0S2ISE2_LEPBO|nr:hypothetical protein LBBP_02329 [Leptospira borgpetersenii serovar Ballum]EKQ91607.1 hypothetical protein LEP1GSC101_0820 [Leptospira borgpetersenii str. UI 09149]EKQ98990.1 hypothetical protein LEP1GSC121_2363 [Leptospira borgpetersenii serovar Castellonis str. 200801910]EMJ84263.1 hypothetical protein LEP1GSC016_2936 [Leptospira borgpetersenii serovar Hardjo-bovis str. Sponselee]EMN59861.1 hypothetical protein LEP1GSC090_2051 [Leptospira borgpetersenii serovar Javanica str. MK146]EMO08060